MTQKKAVRHAEPPKSLSGEFERPEGACLYAQPAFDAQVRKVRGCSRRGRSPRRGPGLAHKCGHAGSGRKRHTCGLKRNSQRFASSDFKHCY